jgi:hypothetical protein
MKQMIKTQTWLLIVLLVWTPSSAIWADVYVRHGQSSEEELQTILQKNGKSHVAFIDYFQEIFPSQRQVQVLHQEFEIAKVAFAEESLATAEKLFHSLLQKRLDADWKTAERQLFAFSYLRWAQLTSDRQERQRRLSEALRYDPYIQASPEIFPPEILKGLDLARALLAEESISWQPQDQQGGFHRLLINGRSYTLPSSQPLRLPNGPMRVTWLSNAYQPHTRNINKVNQLSEEVKRIPLVDGQCFSPTVSSYLSTLVQEFVAVYDRRCFRKYKQSQWDHESLLSIQEPSLNSLADGQSLWKRPVLARQVGPKSLWASPWTWIGITAAATILYQRNREQGPNYKQNPDVILTPTHY